MDELLAQPLTRDWRDQLNEYLAEQEPKGYRIEPEHRWVLEEEILYHAQHAESQPARSRFRVERQSPDVNSTDVQHGARLLHQTARSSGPQILLAAYPSRRGRTSGKTPAAGSAEVSPGKAKGHPGLKRPKPKVPATPTVATKPHLPADFRGTWIEGTKGNGVFQYNDLPVNQRAGIVGAKIRFEDKYIAVGGFPAEAYYGGSAESASVEIETPSGTSADSTAADEAMRKKLRNPSWKRPISYRWNHAGQPGSKTMELVDVKYHEPMAHKGWGADLRAATRASRAARRPRIRGRGPIVGGKSVTGRAVAVMSVYIAARDALRAAGVVQQEFTVLEEMDYYFVAEDGSVFVVLTSWLWGAKKKFIEGPRNGQEQQITSQAVEKYREIAEKKWGRYVPGTFFFSEPRFIPGTDRKTLPFYIEEYGVPRKAGYIDEKGVHRYGQLGPGII